jgi:hypothetical protein
MQPLWVHGITIGVIPTCNRLAMMYAAVMSFSIEHFFFVFRGTAAPMASVLIINKASAISFTNHDWTTNSSSLYALFVHFYFVHAVLLLLSTYYLL